MVMTKFKVIIKIFLTMLLAAFLVSCDLLLELMELKAGDFYTHDFTNNSFYKIKAEMLAEGDKCVIWAEKGSGITKKKAEEIADKYDNRIRPRIVDAFGMKNITKNITVDGENISHTFNDILDYANWLAGKGKPEPEPKLTILLLDIKDGFKDPATDTYVAGYFNSGNFYDQLNSNNCDMIYVDTYPGLQLKPEETYATFAHELQHLINFATTTLKRTDSNGRLNPMDTWIDEGLSSQAEHIYYGKDIEEHRDWFSKDKYGTIANGNNFFVWGNHTKETPMAILDDYSTVYLFFRWLYLQANDNLKSIIFLDIETSTLSDHQIITNVAKQIRPEWADWNVLLRSWLAANYYPENTYYGYKDSFYSAGTGKIRVKPLTSASVKLYPGEGVYSVIRNSFTPPTINGNIRYAGLSGNSSGIATQGSINSNVLLTYNTSTNSDSKTAVSETGSLTGVSASISSAPGSRTLMTEDTQAETPAGPYAIDARDYTEIFGKNK